MRTPANARQRLAKIMWERSLQTGGPFKLASGRLSAFYCDCKPTLHHPEGAYLAATLLLDKTEPFNADYVGGLEMGAPLLTSCLSPLSFLQRRPQLTFFVRKEPKGHGTGKRIEGLTEGETLANSHVVIVEDVTTTGGSALKAAKTVRDAGAAVIGVATLLDRQEGAAKAFAEAGLPFASVFTRAELEALR